jgi:acetoin utilization deacetylase AcuC-like enzyme
MIVLHADDVFVEHDTGEGHPEQPARARVIAGALAKHEAISRVEKATVLATPADLALVHDAGYVAALAKRIASVSGSFAARLDADTAVSPRSHEVALRAAGAVVRATEEAIADPGAALSFCVVRPPGHHARPDRAMGFCLLNNVAVAAAVALERGELSRVAIVDFDVHHGNGTQEMFWRDPRVLYVSLHRYPFYPGTGAADETGEGPGAGTTANFPVKAGGGSARYREAFTRAMDRCRSFNPELVIASAGFDAYARDPIGGLGLAPADFEWIGAELRGLAGETASGRLVSALEGGYAIEALPELVGAYVSGVASPPRRR